MKILPVWILRSKWFAIDISSDEIHPDETAWKIEKLGIFVLERPIISWKVLIEVGQLCRLKVFIDTFLAFF